jgi:hypothetical protein
VDFTQDNHKNETPCIAILNKQKCHFFKQKQDSKAKQVLSGEVGTNRRGDDIRKRDQRVNMVKIFCTRVCK